MHGDTDSIVYIHRPGFPNPLLGDYLGDFEDEMRNGDYIFAFASGGPKNYGYVTAKGKEECKVRGLSLNSVWSRQMNYQFLRQNVLDYIQNLLQEGHARPTSPRPITSSVTPNSTPSRQPAKSRNISWCIITAWLILLPSKRTRTVMLDTPPKMRKWQNCCVNCKKRRVTTRDTPTFPHVNRFFSI